MARETTKWPSTRWPITKIMSSDGCNGNRVPLEMGPWYDFREFGCHLGNVGEFKEAKMTLNGRQAPWLMGAALAALITAPAAAETIKVGMPIPVTLTDLGYYAFGEELGFFKQDNINLRIIVFKGSGKMVPQVATKKLDVGWALPGALFKSYEPGRTRLPVVYFYNILPTWTLQLSVLASSDIKTVADLKGKKVGIGALTWGTIPMLTARLKDAGLIVGENVRYAPVGILGSGFLALKRGRVDALDYNNTWQDLLELSGTKIRRLPIKEKFHNLFTNGFMAHRDTLAPKRDMLVRFARGMAKSSLACQENPAACVKAFWRKHPNMKPKGDEAKSLPASVKMVNNRLALMNIKPKGNVGNMGHWPRNSFEHYVNAYYESGWIKTRDIDIDKMFTNDMIADVNAFDENEVRDKARAAN